MTDTAERMVADSVLQITKILENIIDEANTPKKDKDLEKQTWEKYMRWQRESMRFLTIL